MITQEFITKRYAEAGYRTACICYNMCPTNHNEDRVNLFYEMLKLYEIWEN